MTPPLAAASVLMGFLLLLVGAEVLLTAAVRIALRLGVSTGVVGITLVAASTSLPELLVSVRAAVAGNAGLSVGNVVGSNIFNVLLVLGLAAVIRTCRVPPRGWWFQWAAMLLTAAAIGAVGWSGVITRFEGGVLFAGYVSFLAVTRHQATTLSETPSSPDIPAGMSDALAAHAARVIVGVILLAAGPDLLVRGAASLAHSFGVSERIIGLSVLAIGTSLPELVTSAVAAWRGQQEIAVANVVGSNIFNGFAILGLTALILPVPVAPAFVRTDVVWMVGVTAALGPLTWRGELGRWQGGLLLALAASYSATLFMAA